MKSRKLRFYFGLLAIVLIAFVLHSCTKADVTFGQQWVDNDYTKTNMVDTFTPQLSTIYQDSFPSNGTGYGLIGVYRDPAFGVVQASTYLRLQPPAIKQAIVDSLAGAVYDSAVVFMKLKNNEYGDTTQTLTLNVYQLARQINYYDNTSNLYNTSSFPVNSTPIGTGTFTLNPNIPQPLTGDTLQIRLNDVLGQDMFTRLKTFNPYMQNPTDFLTYFNGIKISGTATNNNGFIFNIQDSARIRIYYTIQGLGQRIRQYSEFYLNGNQYQFNSVSVDRTGTPLGNVGIGSSNRNISSTLTGNLAYLQQTTGTAVKVTFPSIQDIANQPNYLRLVRAILTVWPSYNTYLPYYAVPTSLSIVPTANYSNAYIESAGTPASPYMDPILRQYSYAFDITNYINNTELTSVDLSGRGLILFLPSSMYKTRMNRLVIGDVVNRERSGGIKLQLYYISVR